MKNTVRKAIRNEAGNVMALTLVLLAVGGLILAPLLGLTGTGLVAGQVYEKKTAELYAADAGVEDAAWNIQNEVAELPWPGRCGNYTTWSYPIADVNGKSVNVTITFVDDVLGVTYRILSTAVGTDGSGTQVEAYVSGSPLWGDYSGITDHIVCSLNTTDIAKKVNLVYEDEENGPVENYPGDWPTPATLILFYSRDVDKSESYPYATLDVKDHAGGIGPFFREGDLDIVNTGAAGLTLKFNGTVYVTGKVTVGNTNQDFYLDLNDNAFFVESAATNPPKHALYIGGKCSTKGPGVVVAIGDIYYEPKSQTGGEDSPIFIISVLGMTTLKPSGEFYGAVAGSVEVVIQQGTEPTLTYPLGGFEELNWPGLH